MTYVRSTIANSLITLVLLLATIAYATPVRADSTWSAIQSNGVLRLGVLDAPPCPGETVTVTPASMDTSEGNVSGAVMFTTANWNVPQDVTVTPGTSGDGDMMDVTYNATNTVASDDPTGCYDGVTADSVSITNHHNSGKTESSTTFCDLCHPVQIDKLFLKFRIRGADSFFALFLKSH